MPLYEYRCRECDHRFEVLQSSGEGGESLHCPQCGAGHPQKEFSTFASHSSGTGASSLGASAPSGCGPGGFT
jgi:putative FmdB family regulatory protein